MFVTGILRWFRSNSPLGVQNNISLEVLGESVQDIFYPGFFIITFLINRIEEEEEEEEEEEKKGKQ